MNQTEEPATVGALPPEAPAWRAGHRIGSFELQAALPSSGGAGIVYRAWDFALARPVAIKEYFPAVLARRRPNGEVHPAVPADADAFSHGRDAFVTECQVLARCDHPSLVRMLHIVEAYRTAYCVMPWYAGRPLLEVRPKMGDPVQEPFLRSLLDGLLGALDAYHRVGGMHGGVSPSKVLLLDDDRALLLGPGAAGRVTRRRSRDAAALLPGAAFLAPEQTSQADEQPQGPWTDFYALAAIARYWITGIQPPGAGRAPTEPLAATVERLFADRPAVRYSLELLRGLDAAMSADIAKRPQTAAQFRQWLVRASNEPAAAPVVAPQILPPIAPPIAPPILPPIAPPIARPSPPAPAARAPLPREATDWGADDAEEEVDPATVDAIRRVIDSIPAALDHAPRRAALSRSRLDAAAESSQHQRDLRPPGARLQARRSRGPLWAGLAVAAVAVVAIGAWQLLPPNDDSIAMAPTLDDAFVPATKPGAGRVLAPAPAPGTTPGIAPVQPAAEGVEPAPPAVAAPAAPSAAEQALAHARAAAPPTQAQTPAPTPTPPQTQLPAQALAQSQTQTPTPTRSTARAANEPAPASPRAQCGARTEFSLYRCMQQQCELAMWQRHPQCVRLKATDSVD